MFFQSDWNSSYILGNDTQDGWGQRYFFTFYSEFGEREGAAGVEVGVLVVIFVSSILANLSIAAAVLRYREMRTVTNCFLLNLAVADSLFALGIPAVIVARISPKWQLGDIVCKLLPYSQFVCGFVLLWTLTLISMDRHRCIVVPPYRSRLTPRLATALTLAIWFLAALLFLPVAFWFREEPELQICTLVFPRYELINLSICFTVPMIFFTCLLPMSLLVYHYQRIFHKLIKTRNRWTNNNLASPSGSDPSRRISEMSVTRKISLQQIVYPTRSGTLSHHEELRLNKHVRVVRVLLLNVLVVLNMWLPITVVMFLIYVDGRRPTEDPNFFLRSHHFIWALLIALLNTVVNPVLYGVLSENFRACFSRLWFGSQRRKNAARDIMNEGGSNAQRSSSKNKTQTPEQENSCNCNTKGTQTRLCYHLSCSDPTIDVRRVTSCSKHHSSPGSVVSVTDVHSSVTNHNAFS